MDTESALVALSTWSLSNMLQLIEFEHFLFDYAIRVEGKRLFRATA